MRFVQLSTARSIDVELPQRADATPTFRVLSPSGGATLTATNVSMDAVNTTLNGAAAAGAQTITLTSVASVTAGRKYLIGTNTEALGGERGSGR